MENCIYYYSECGTEIVMRHTRALNTLWGYQRYHSLRHKTHIELQPSTQMDTQRCGCRHIQTHRDSWGCPQTQPKPTADTLNAMDRERESCCPKRNGQRERVMRYSIQRTIIKKLKIYIQVTKSMFTIYCVISHDSQVETLIHVHNRVHASPNLPDTHLHPPQPLVTSSRANTARTC